MIWLGRKYFHDILIIPFFVSVGAQSQIKIKLICVIWKGTLKKCSCSHWRVGVLTGYSKYQENLNVNLDSIKTSMHAPFRGKYVTAKMSASQDALKQVFTHDKGLNRLYQVFSDCFNKKETYFYRCR